MSHPTGHVLVVDDQEYVRESIASLLERRGHRVRSAGTADDAASAVASHPVDAVVTDLNLPGKDGLDLVRILARESPRVPVIVLTGHGSVASAVECMRAGAFDYLEKPADPEALSLTVERALGWAQALRELERLRRSAEPDEDEPVGESVAWRKVMALVDASSEGDTTVLVLGESGAGKDVVAREIHRRSRRREGPFVAVNCAAIAPDLFESEFFGHRRGAFTGALADSEGRFRLAHGGTLFLDEVSCMPPASQAKLLRVLQDGTFERVGDARMIHVDVRVIAATNSALEADVAAGRFRQDLLYRLDVARISVPPLRQRLEDIPLLCAHLLPRLTRRTNRAVTSIAPETLRVLASYAWPGNVRELQNVLERALILERTPQLQPSSLPFEAPSRAKAAPPITASDLNLRDAAMRAEREVIREALRQSRGVRSEAARLLGIDPRNLSYYLRRHEIRIDREAGSEPGE